jgi:hypothetical protein
VVGHVERQEDSDWVNACQRICLSCKRGEAGAERLRKSGQLMT